MITLKLFYAVFLFCLFTVTGAFCEGRFPHPDFESNYEVPSTSVPDPTDSMTAYLDVFILFAALSIASFLVLKKRSRKSIFALMLFAIAYFGFWRKGCICPVGSTQNIAMALFDNGYTMPLSVLAFFILPLIFALFFGRTFCAAVCPLGAIQDAVILQPLKIPSPVKHALSIIPYVYLATAVLLAATGSAFIICRIDPFVSFFRLSGNAPMLALGATFLIIGIFIARPYCRFVCPYSVLLNISSHASKYHATITPDECIQCKLCEESCPFDAIRKPVPTHLPEEHGKAIRRLVMYLALLPVITALCGWTFSQIYVPLSQLNNSVILAEQINSENAGTATGTTLRSDAFRSSGKSLAELDEEAEQIRQKLKKGGWLAGIFVGLVISIKLILLTTRRTRKDYEPDRGECLSCGRCFTYCPVHKDNLKHKHSTTVTS